MIAQSTGNLHSHEKLNQQNLMKNPHQIYGNSLKEDLDKQDYNYTIDLDSLNHQQIRVFLTPFNIFRIVHLLKLRLGFLIKG